MENEKVEVIDNTSKIDMAEIKSMIQSAIKDAMPAVKAEKITQPSVKKVVKGKSKYFSDSEDAYEFGAFIAKQMGYNFETKAISTYSNEGTAADGLNLVPTEATNVIIDLVEKKSVALRNARVFRMTGNTLTFNVDAKEFSVYVVGEGTATTAEKIALTLKTITAKKLMALAYVSNELIADAIINFADYVANKLATDFAKKIDFLVFAADGTADTTDGGITGVIPAIVAVSGNDSIIESHGTWSELTVRTCERIVGTLPDYAEDNAKWFCTKPMAAMLQALGAAAGGTTAEYLVGQKPVKMFLGYPIEVVDGTCMATSHTDEGIELLFGDLASTVAVGIRSEIAVKVSDVAGDAFAQDLTAIKGVQRTGVTVFNPGTSSAVGGMIAVKFSEAYVDSY